MFSNINRISGLSGSGFDTEGTIEKLMTAARAPYDRMFQKKQLLTWRKETYRDMNTTIASFRDTSFNMKLQGTFMVKKASSSDETKVSVTGTAAAMDGTSKIKVEQLAEGAAKTSTGKITVAGGNTASLRSQFFTADEQVELDKLINSDIALSFKINGHEFKYTKDDLSNLTMSDLAAHIRGANIGVTANYDANVDLLFLSTSGTGSDKKIELQDGVSVAGIKFLENKLKLDMNSAAGKDAKIYLNDMADPILQNSNNFTINGLTYNLKAKTDPAVNGGYVSVTTTTDVDAVFNNIKKFMDDYNKTLDTIYNKVNEKYNRKFPPLTDAQKKVMKEDDIKKWEEKAKTGLLTRDNILNGVLDDMRFNMTNPVKGLDKTSQLTAIGIETGKYAEHGKLKFADLTGDKLKEAIKANPDGIISLFTKSGEKPEDQGIAVRLKDIMEQAIKNINDVAGFSTRTDDQSVLGKQITDIGDRMDKEEDRLVDLENRYWQKFTAMEKALSSMGNQSSWLSQQLGGGN